MRALANRSGESVSDCKMLPIKKGPVPFTSRMLKNSGQLGLISSASTPCVKVVLLPTTSPPLGETSEKPPLGETREREQALKITFSTACSGFHAAAAARLTLRR